MASRRFKWRDYLSWGLLALSVLFLLFALLVSRAPGDTEYAATRLEHKLQKRMKTLDSYAARALGDDADEWLELAELPPDMVIYRYVGDTLKSWNNSFTVSNDNISLRIVFPRLTNPMVNLTSPLSFVTEKPSFVNLGQKWYLLKALYADDVEVIAGLEVMNSLDQRSANNVNPRLHLNGKFSLITLDTSCGTPVSVDGIPQFKLMNYSLKRSTPADSMMVWVSLLLFLLALLVFLSAHRTLHCFRLVILALAAVLLWMYFWGESVRTTAGIFSPTLYADGEVFHSLGAVLVLNLTILSIVICVYMVRRELYRKLLCHRDRRRFAIVAVCAGLTLLAAISAYCHLSFSSIVSNSSITLELYKIGSLSLFTLVVYLSYITLLVSVMLLLQLLRPCFRRVFGRSYDAFSVTGRTLIAVCAGLYFVTASAVLGFRKEQQNAELWAGRLSVERDISLELRLRQVENQIAGDAIISALSALPNAASVVFNRVVDNYMYTISQDYDISIMLFDSETKDPSVLNFFNERIRKGTPIMDSSHFMYTTTVSGLARYTGLFTYISQKYGVNYMLLSVEPKSNRDYRGYSTLLGMSSPGKVVMPSAYTYARYKDGKLISYKGSFAYPTLVSASLRAHLEHSAGYFLSDGYTHFVTGIDEDEFVLVSRRRTPFVNFIVAFAFLSLACFVTLSAASLTRRRRPEYENSYFRSRISTMLMLSLILTLVVMAVVSVVFVFQRNDANKTEMMSDKITSITALMGDVCRYVSDYRELDPKELTAVTENVARTSKSDITLFSPSGKVFRTTASDIYDRMILSDRINQKAYHAIVYDHMRYCIVRERIGGKGYYALYAPLINADGKIVAILSTPYIEENYDFEMEAALHSVTILSVFLILLLMTRFMVTAMLDKMFRPLLELGRRMNSTDVDSLEYIRYDREDEISTLVKAYNMMVSDLKESTRQLAQAERDKAWSSMARQVAHEIKNPLTPMKLQIQRIIRMKDRQLPGWEDKFDQAAKIVLDHIDILTDTANEFSTFAKLYSEEPSQINLDALLQEEIAMFDNKENISFSYMGLSGVTVTGPKPQLTRVFVNLLSNSIQAIELKQQEAVEAGREPEQGRILVSLRHSVSGEGYYDIVFEDNGPGVSSENTSKLFTPNFTTKSSGTGLGLAISRSIIEKCEGEISYSKSFALEGACFIIKYPASRGQ